MKFASVCSGIEAASVAWHPLGWRAAFFSEIAKFPSALLAHHYPDVPNLGDMTKYESWPDATVDLLVGGTPCQSFSHAGLRRGLDDPRGNLMLTYLAIAKRYRPRWLLWENVPGVLTSGKGRDFGTLLTGLAELGYGFAYRVLDAQFCRASGFLGGVPQRRRRVFVVAYLGDWRPAAEVLFDRESLRGTAPPVREAWSAAAVLSGDGFEIRCGEVAPTILAGQNPGDRPYGTDIDTVESLVAYRQADRANYLPADGAAATLTASGGDTGNGGGETLVAYRATGVGSYDPAEGAAATLRATGGDMTIGGDETLLATSWAIRRLMPVECERLQGFPDGYTLVPYRRGMSADGPRYHAIGNSMAVSVMRVLGERMEEVDRRLAA